VNWGTIPSKTLREAIVYLTGLSQRAAYGESYRVKEEITIEDLRLRAQQVMDREVDIVRHQLMRNHVQIVEGVARFLDPHTVAVSGREERRLTAEWIVIATGTRPVRPPAVEFDDRTIFDSDSLLRLDRLPASGLVVGAGVIGIEYASMFAALGVKVTVVEKRPRLLDFCDAQITEGLQYHLRDLGVVFRLGEEVTAVDRHDGAALTHLASGKRVASDVVLYAAGRQGETEELELDNVGLEADERGRIAVGTSYRTAVEHIYAAGDVIGWPALAATSMEQGRVASAHAFGDDAASMSELLPIGIYTIPEISYVGRTEEELTEAAVPGRPRSRSSPGRAPRAPFCPPAIRGASAGRRCRRGSARAPAPGSVRSPPRTWRVEPAACSCRTSAPGWTRRRLRRLGRHDRSLPREGGA
jgi:NAD(P) transhydrogenase